MKSLGVYVGAVVSLFVGLVLVTVRNPLGIVFVVAAVATMFATSFSAAGLGRSRIVAESKGESR